jgi:hypothetical protein
MRIAVAPTIAACGAALTAAAVAVIGSPAPALVPVARAIPCSPGEDLYQCMPPVTALTAGDQFRVSKIQVIPDYANVDPLVIARVWDGVMGLLDGGDTTHHVVHQIQQYAGGSLGAAGQFLDIELENIGGTVGADGKLHR